MLVSKGASSNYRCPGLLICCPRIPTISKQSLAQPSLYSQGEVAKGSGALSLSVDSKQASLTSDLLLREGTIQLAAPVEAHLTLTEELGKMILSQMNPLLITAVRGENPIRLRIEQEGFSIPLFNWSNWLEGIHIEQAQVDLGKIWLKNRGRLRRFFSLFKRPQLNQEKEILAWSTPLYLNVKEGIVNYQRMDTVIGTSFQLASWGRLDLLNKRIDFTAGVPGYSLRKVLGISGLPDDHYLLIPIRGPLGHVRIDWAKAGARLASLFTQREGETGRLLGDLLGILTREKREQERVPSPTTTPFPWEGDPLYHFPSQSEDKAEPTPKKRAIKAIEKGIKKIKTKSLLKKRKRSSGSHN